MAEPSPEADNERWLLPAGIEEILPPDALRLEQMRRDLIDLYLSWGYELVIPPFLEYLESLLTGTGRDLDLQTFKVTDQESGRLMGLRADMTPQAARIDAHHMRGTEAPVRLCYIGTVVHARPSRFLGSRTPLQVGAELYGHAGVESDLEILSLMIETMRCVGLEGIHIDLGHFGIFRGLASAAGLGEPLQVRLFEVLQRKAAAEIEDILAAASVGPQHARRILALNRLNGGPEVLAQARRVYRGANRMVIAALDYLESLARLLERHHPSAPVHFDLAELRGYRYHAGAVFAVFVPGHGQEVARGGRYDHIGEAFGRARPATGFSTDLKVLLALTRGRAEGPGAGGGIFAPLEADASLAREVRTLRRNGERVVYALPGQQGGARELGCDRRLRSRDGRWEVVALEPA